MKIVLQRILLSIISFSLIITATKPALADIESWNFIESKIPIIEKSQNFPKTNLRVFTGAFINKRSQGIGDLLIRLDPLIDINSWMYLGFGGVLMADRTSTGNFIQEIRAEIEPNFFGKIGDFSFLDRNRLEYRTRATGNMVWYRNMAKLNYAPKDQLISYFISNEIFFDTINRNIIQNRAGIGFGININKNLKLDTGYIFRSRYIQSLSSWENDHVLAMTLSIDYTK